MIIDNPLLQTTQLTGLRTFESEVHGNADDAAPPDRIEPESAAP